MTGRRRTGRRSAALVAAVFGLAAALFAAPAVATVPIEDDTLAIVGADVTAFPTVVLEVESSASGADGVAALGPDDVSVTENGRPVAFELQMVPSASLELVLLIDTSGSMSDRDAIGAARAAVTSLLDEVPADVAIGIVGFSDTPSLVSPLTTDRDQLRAALAELRARGETALYDAVVFGASLFSGADVSRRFVLVSDGGDTVSVNDLAAAVAVATAVPTSAIELVTFESDRAGLQALTDAGGGRLVAVDDPAGLETITVAVVRGLVQRARLVVQARATGPTEYEVTVRSGEVERTARRTIQLPAAPVTEPGTSEPAPAPTTEAPTTTPAGPTDEPTDTIVEDTTDDAGSGAIPGSDGGRSGSATWLLVLGALAVFASITSLALFARPANDDPRAGRDQLGVTPGRATGTSGAIGRNLSDYADRALERGGRRRGLSEALDVAAVSLRPGEFVIVVAALAVTAAAVLGLVAGPVGALIGVALVVLGARAVLSIRGDRRRRAFAAQLPDVLQLLTSGLRAGYALPQAIDAVANQAAAPARDEFRRVTFETRVGRDLDDALAATAARMRSPDFDWVVSAFEINREVGGELAQVLDNVAATVRERQELAREIRTLTAEGRMSAYVLTALPFALAAAVLVVNPDYFQPFTESPGPTLLGVAAGLLLVGWIWMRRLIRSGG